MTKKEYQKIYRETHKEQINAYAREWKHNHPGHEKEWRRKYQKDRPEKMAAYSHKWYELNREKAIAKAYERSKRRRQADPERERRRVNEYRKKNIEKIRAQRNTIHRNRYKNDPDYHATVNKNVATRKRNRYHSDPAYRMRINLRNRISSVIKIKNLRKSNKSLELIGCTSDQLRNYIEKLWLPGMSWDNYNYRGWHIDHIRPVSSFDLTDPEQQRQCFHYTNLQPLWAKDNLAKRDNYDPTTSVAANSLTCSGNAKNTPSSDPSTSIACPSIVIDEKLPSLRIN